MLKFAINEATTMKASFQVDIKAYSQAGFKAVELWLPKLERYLGEHTLEDVDNLLRENRIRPIAACFQGDLMLSEGKERKQAIESFKRRLKICQRLSCPILVVPTDFPKKVELSMYDEDISNIQEVGDIAKDLDVSLAIEFIQGASFLGTLETTAKLIKKVKRKNVGIVLDMFHFYAGESKWEDFNLVSKGDILLVHLNDVKDIPREIMADKDRVLPGEGILPIKEIIERLKKIGYKGYYSLELFSEELWKMPVQKAVEKAIRSLRSL